METSILENVLKSNVLQEGNWADWLSRAKSGDNGYYRGVEDGLNLISSIVSGQGTPKRKDRIKRKYIAPDKKTSYAQGYGDKSAYQVDAANVMGKNAGPFMRYGCPLEVLPMDQLSVQDVLDENALQYLEHWRQSTPTERDKLAVMKALRCINSFAKDGGNAEMKKSRSHNDFGIPKGAKVSRPFKPIDEFAPQSSTPEQKKVRPKTAVEKKSSRLIQQNTRPHSALTRTKKEDEYRHQRQHEEIERSQNRQAAKKAGRLQRPQSAYELRGTESDIRSTYQDSFKSGDFWSKPPVHGDPQLVHKVENLTKRKLLERPTSSRTKGQSSNSKITQEDIDAHNNFVYDDDDDDVYVPMTTSNRTLDEAFLLKHKMASQNSARKEHRSAQAYLKVIAGGPTPRYDENIDECSTREPSKQSSSMGSQTPQTPIKEPSKSLSRTSSQKQRPQSAHPSTSFQREMKQDTSRSSSTVFPFSELLENQTSEKADTKRTLTRPKSAGSIRPQADIVKQRPQTASSSSTQWQRSQSQKDIKSVKQEMRKLNLRDLLNTSQTSGPPKGAATVAQQVQEKDIDPNLLNKLARPKSAIEIPKSTSEMSSAQRDCYNLLTDDDKKAFLHYFCETKRKLFTDSTVEARKEFVKQVKAEVGALAKEVVESVTSQDEDEKKKLAREEDNRERREFVKYLKSTLATLEEAPSEVSTPKSSTTTSTSVKQRPKSAHPSLRSYGSAPSLKSMISSSTKKSDGSVKPQYRESGQNTDVTGTDAAESSTFGTERWTTLAKDVERAKLLKRRHGQPSSCSNLSVVSLPTGSKSTISSSNRTPSYCESQYEASSSGASTQRSSLSSFRQQKRPSSAASSRSGVRSNASTVSSLRTPGQMREAARQKYKELIIEAELRSKGSSLSNTSTKKETGSEVERRMIAEQSIKTGLSLKENKEKKKKLNMSSLRLNNIPAKDNSIYMISEYKRMYDRR